MFGKYVFVVTPEASHPRQPRERGPAFIPVIVAMGLVVTVLAYSGAVLRDPVLSLFPLSLPAPARSCTEAAMGGERERERERVGFAKCTETLAKYGQSLAVTLNASLDLLRCSVHSRTVLRCPRGSNGFLGHPRDFSRPTSCFTFCDATRERFVIDGESSLRRRIRSRYVSVDTSIRSSAINASLGVAYFVRSPLMRCRENLLLR